MATFYDWLLGRDSEFRGQSTYALEHKDDFPREPKTRDELLAYLKAKRDCDVEVGRGFVHALGLYTSQHASKRDPEVEVSANFSAGDEEKEPPNG